MSSSDSVWGPVLEVYRSLLSPATTYYRGWQLLKGDFLWSIFFRTRGYFINLFYSSPSFQTTIPFFFSPDDLIFHFTEKTEVIWWNSLKFLTPYLPSDLHPHLFPFCLFDALFFYFCLLDPFEAGRDILLPDYRWFFHLVSGVSALLSSQGTTHLLHKYLLSTYFVIDTMLR